MISLGVFSDDYLSPRSLSPKRGGFSLVLIKVPVSGVYGEAGRVRLVRVRLVAHPTPVQ
jgi:hypothetical protein